MTRERRARSWLPPEQAAVYIASMQAIWRLPPSSDAIQMMHVEFLHKEGPNLISRTCCFLSCK